MTRADGERPTLALRLLCPHQAAVVDVVRVHVGEQPGASVSVELVGDLVLFCGETTDARLRRRVGAALVKALGPVGWTDYFGSASGRVHQRNGLVPGGVDLGASES